MFSAANCHIDADKSKSSRQIWKLVESVGHEGTGLCKAKKQKKKAAHFLRVLTFIQPAVCKSYFAKCTVQ